VVFWIKEKVTKVAVHDFCGLFSLRPKAITTYLSLGKRGGELWWPKVE
jgi:hypothetical protein